MAFDSIEKCNSKVAEQREEIRNLSSFLREANEERCDGTCINTIVLWSVVGFFLLAFAYSVYMGYTNARRLNRMTATVPVTTNGMRSRVDNRWLHLEDAKNLKCLYSALFASGTVIILIKGSIILYPILVGEVLVRLWQEGYGMG